MTPLSLESALAERVADVPHWYHSIKLPGDIITPGGSDTIDELHRIPFPASLEGSRCLDIGTADGFWAFEMERRGAAEVVAIDVGDPTRQDWPGNSSRGLEACWDQMYARRSGFELAHEVLESKVQWRDLRVDELDPQDIGSFDFVFMGSLLLHLRDPVGALLSVSSVLRGEFFSVDTLSPPLTILHPGQPVARIEAPGWPLWWKLNLQAYRRLFPAAGLEVIATGRPFFVKPGARARGSFKRGGASSNRKSLLLGIEHSVISRLGVVHSWVRARAGSRSI